MSVEIRVRARIELKFAMQFWPEILGLVHCRFLLHTPGSSARRSKDSDRME